MRSIRHSLIQNHQMLQSIVEPYKKQRQASGVLISVNDFIQIHCRLKIQGTQLKQLFTEEQHISDKIMRDQLDILKQMPKNFSHFLAESQDQVLKSLSNLVQIPKSNQVEMDIFQDLLEFGKMFQTAHFKNDETVNDLSGLCNEAYLKLCDDYQPPFIEQLSPISKRNLNPHPTPASNQSYIKAEWDSKMESKSQINISADDRIRQAFMFLEQENFFDAENLRILQKCCEVHDNSIDRKMYFELFLQAMKSKKPTKKKQSDESILREQVLLVPIAQEFSLESILPSQRTDIATPMAPPPPKHVNLQDLLDVQGLYEQIEESNKILEESPKHFIKKQVSKPHQRYDKPQIKRVSKSTNIAQNNSSTDGSFYSQKNLKSLLLQRSKSRKQSIESDPLKRCRSTPIVEPVETSRPQQKKKIVKKCSTERSKP